MKFKKHFEHEQKENRRRRLTVGCCECERSHLMKFVFKLFHTLRLINFPHIYPYHLPAVPLW